YRALGGQVFRGHFAALGVQRGQPAGVDHLVGGLEPQVGEAGKLRHPAVQRHLATLETGRHLGPGLGALGAPAGRLALGCLSPADPGARLVRAGRRAQVVEPQAEPAGRRLSLACHGQSTSSTVTKWRTARIMPRNSGLSSLTTTSPIRFRPRDRSELRCCLVPPILDLVWVTLSCVISLPSLSSCLARRWRRPPPRG